MGQSEGTKPGHQNHGLGIADPTAARGGVAVVSHRQITGHAGQNLLIKHLADQAHVLMQADLAFVEHGDARRFLAAMLQGIQAEVGEVGDRLFPCENSKDAAGLLHAIGTLRLAHVHRAPRLQTIFRILHQTRSDAAEPVDGPVAAGPQNNPD